MKELIRKGQPAFGTWITLMDTVGTEAIAGVGFDWLVFDLEHTALTSRELVHMCQSVAPLPVSPLARVREVSEAAIKKVLSAGVQGVVVPNVQDRVQAEALIDWCKYPPEGKRGVGGARSWISTKVKAYEDLVVANEQTIIFVQLEHIEAVERAEDILSVPGIDVCYVGLDDLCTSMGVDLSEKYVDPRVEEALQAILAAAESTGVAPGIHSQTPEMATRRSREGWRILGVGGDLGFMTSGARVALEQVREALRTVNQADDPAAHIVLE